MSTQRGRRGQVAVAVPRPTSALLGRDPDTAIPVQTVVGGLARRFRQRFPEALWLGGELVQVRHARGGRVFAVLRDGTCRADVHLPPHVARQGEIPSSGTMVVVKGTLRIREQAGSFRIEAETRLIPTDGAGARGEARRAAERELRAEGVFDRRKREIPSWPSEVAVVSSFHGAVIEDVRAVIRRRAPWVRVRLHDCAVQGVHAPATIVQALRKANRSAADVVIVARGGGATDDLDAFDQPQVVREIAASRAPVIVAVGHEPDSTLSDLAADLSAPTPSAAAECAVPDRRELRGRLDHVRQRIHVAAWHRLVDARADLHRKVQRGERAAQRSGAIARERLERWNPQNLLGGLERLIKAERRSGWQLRKRITMALQAQLQRQRRRAEELAPGVLVRSLRRAVRERRRQASALIRAARALSPETLLARGYAIPLWADARVRGRQGLEVGSRFELLLDDVVVAVVVEDVTERPGKGGTDDRAR